MCRINQFKLAILGLLFSLGAVMSASAACPITANHVGSGQSIATLAKGSGISVNNVDLPAGVAECQVFIVDSTVSYAGITTYAWTGTGTPTVTAVAGLSPFGAAESVHDVTPANWLTTVVSLPSNLGCVGVETEALAPFEYTPTAADIAAGGVTFVLQYTGAAVGGAGGVNGGAFITVVINECDDGDPCTIDACVPDLTGLATCTTTPLCTDPCSPCVNGVCTPIVCDPCSPCVEGVCTPLVCDPCSPCVAGVCTPIVCDPCFTCVNGTCTAVVCDPCFPCDVTTGQCATTTICGNAGCTPGFYKNCTSQWPVPTSTTLSGAGFILPACLSGCSFNGNTTILAALSLKGGSSLCAGTETLLRAAAAGYLNSLRVNYPLTTQQVIDQVNAALASCNRSTVITLAGTLDANNNLGCKDANGDGLPCKGHP